MTLNNRRTGCKFFRTAVTHLLNNTPKKLHIRPRKAYVIHNTPSIPSVNISSVVQWSAIQTWVYLAFLSSSTQKVGIISKQATSSSIQITFRCDIPLVFYKLITKYINTRINQNTAKLLYYVTQYVSQLRVSALFFRPSSGCVH